MGGFELFESPGTPTSAIRCWKLSRRGAVVVCGRGSRRGEPSIDDDALVGLRGHPWLLCPVFRTVVLGAIGYFSLYLSGGIKGIEGAANRANPKPIFFSLGSEPEKSGKRSVSGTSWFGSEARFGTRGPHGLSPMLPALNLHGPFARRDKRPRTVRAHQLLLSPRMNPFDGSKARRALAVNRHAKSLRVEAGSDP